MSMSYFSFSIHGHFYQPPREDPINGLIPNEAGSAPYSNWNEKIHAECYRPNAELGNFARISFNVGPTLCEWMESHDPETCAKIVEQDRSNVRKFGVGNAMAQAYNHTILPLATYEDKVTQVVWGIADFEHRFGRKPQGMWIPETAADLETLSVLAENGIEFTILAPWQAKSNPLDPTRPYRISLPNGRSIIAFFYHAELSTRISFDPSSTTNADVFADHYLKPLFKPQKTKEPRFLLIASDGELYGHHQQFRDRFLAHMVNGAGAQAQFHPSYPARWLKEHPVRRAMSIRNRTSWSCHHGLMRWMGDCGCTPGDGVWKYYLRRAFDRLAASLNQVYSRGVLPYIYDPRDLRNRYAQVFLGNQSVEELIQSAAGRILPGDVVRKIGLLLRAQYERQRMFTSCGWFFEDFARIEPKNSVAYAAQAVHLTRLATGIDLSAQAMADLQHVISHRSGLRGDIVFQRQLQRTGTSRYANLTGIGN